MTKEERIEKYQQWVKRCSAYRMALEVIGIDKMTVAPPAGSEYRDERAAILSGELFGIENDPEIASLMKELMQDDLDPDMKKAVELYDRRISRDSSVPQEFYTEFQRLIARSYNAWLNAKVRNDYTLFEPLLKQVISGTAEKYGYWKSELSLYDRMLDEYEPGMRMTDYDVFFEAVKKRLVPLIREIALAEPIRTGFLYETYPIEKQKIYMDQILRYLHFDSSWGYQNETEHPFTSWLCENDCRTTTKYIENNVASAILSTVHEVGHATYEHQIDPAYDGMILSDGVSSGMHESQSRLFENCLGRTEAFWAANYDGLQRQFPQQLGHVARKEFVDALNASGPSLIRTEADELTYPIHILIRYEIEKGLFNGSITTAHLDRTWNQMYRQYLGVEAKTAAEGILQDVHWSEGAFGYFPTYALGSAIAAQIMYTMEKQIDVSKLLESNQFEVIREWLRENVQQYGCRYTANEILLSCTKERFNPEYYFDYLEKKYRRLYHLEKGNSK